MGKILDWLLGPDLSTAASVTVPASSGDVVQVSDLPPEVATAFGITTTNPTGPIRLEDALKVGAFARGRDLIAGTGGKLTLRSLDQNRNRIPRAILDQPNPNTSRQYELTKTIEDLICYPVAWWLVLDTAGGYKTSAKRIDPRRVRIVEGSVYLDGSRLANPDEMLIRFDGWHAGVLTTAADVLRTAIDLENAVARYARNPRPDGYLYDKREYDPTKPDVDAERVTQILKKWDDGNRANPTRWLNRSTGYERLTWSPTELGLSQQREASAVQVARHLNLPNRQVNAATTGDSMTYSTTLADRTDFLDITLDNYLVTIEQRLSMPDIVSPAETVTFDREAYVLGSAIDRMTIAAQAVQAGLLDIDEARTRYLNLPPRSSK